MTRKSAANRFASDLPEGLPDKARFIIRAEMFGEKLVYFTAETPMSSNGLFSFKDITGATIIIPQERAICEELTD